MDTSTWASDSNHDPSIDRKELKKQILRRAKELKSKLMDFSYELHAIVRLVDEDVGTLIDSEDNVASAYTKELRAPISEVEQHMTICREMLDESKLIMLNTI